MHSRIFQISTAPIDEVDYIEETQYYDHWFTNSLADYVNGDTDRTKDIEWLKCVFEDRGITFGDDGDGAYFIVEDKAKYFAPKFAKFQEELAKLSNVDIEGFISGKCALSLMSLKLEYNDDCGFYVDDDYYDLISFDEFVRRVQVGVRYFIGATIDYHF